MADRDTQTNVRLIIGAVLLALLIAVVADNTGKTRVGYVVGDVRAPLFLVLLATALAGALIAWIVKHHRT